MDFDAHERARWNGRAAAYDRSFARLCAHPAEFLLTAAGVGRGRRVLDIGTGTGTVAALARGTGATVLAADAEPTMIALAADRLAADHLLLAALPALPFRDAVLDAVVANFVLNHVADPLLAVTELRRVIRPGGRVALTVWPSPPGTAQRLWGEIFDEAGAIRPPGMPRLDAGKDFPRTEAGLAALMTGAGLTDVRVDTLSWELKIDAEDWWAGPASGIANPGLVMEHQLEDAIPAIRSAYDRRTEPFRRPDGLLHLPTSALLAVGSSAR